MTYRPNESLIRQIIAELKRHPERHSQHQFGVITDCGTTHCIGGMAAALTDGVRLNWDDDGFLRTVTIGQRVEPVEVAARRLLGIDKATADSLFYDRGNTKHMIGRLQELLGAEPRHRVGVKS